RRRRHSERIAVDAQRDMLPQPHLVGRSPLDRIGNGEKSSQGHSEGFRQIPREANYDSNVRSQSASDTSPSLLDSWQCIARQEIVELLEIDVEGVGNRGQIVNRQYSSR